MVISKDTKCIPLAHIQSYFDLSKGITYDHKTLEQKTQLNIPNPNTLLSAMMGITPRDFYLNAGIDCRGDLSSIFISPSQCVSLVDQTVRALEMPYLGLAMGNLMTIAHHGMAGVAAVTQPDLRSCLEVMTRFCAELFPPLEMHIEIDGNEAKFVMSENVSMAPYSEYFYEINMISFYNIFKQLVGGDRELTSVDFCYPEPAWGHIYRRYFHCPVRFNQPDTCLRGDVKLGDCELPLANRRMALMAEKTLFENIPTCAIRLVPVRLRRLLIRYYGAFPSLEAAASSLGMSGRTLSRKLAEDGTTFQQELDAVRQKLAKEYFHRGGQSVTQVALLLGFTDSSNFAKAFRRWTGVSPSAFMDDQAV
jgi:AraC-like DNA-binding protein